MRLFAISPLVRWFPPSFLQSPLTHNCHGLSCRQALCYDKHWFFTGSWPRYKLSSSLSANSGLGGIKNVANTCKPLIRINRNNINATVVCSVAYNFFYNIASRATQSNSVTYACSKSRWCTLALMAWANCFARIFCSRERPLWAWEKIFRYFATIMDRNRDSTHQSQNEDNFRPFLLG